MVAMSCLHLAKGKRDLWDWGTVVVGSILIAKRHEAPEEEQQSRDAERHAEPRGGGRSEECLPVHGRPAKGVGEYQIEIEECERRDEEVRLVLLAEIHGPDALPRGAGVISASNYDESCNVDSDCQEVTSRDYCSAGCLCGGSAINVGAVAQFKADVSKTPLGSGALRSPRVPMCCFARAMLSRRHMLHGVLLTDRYPSDLCERRRDVHLERLRNMRHPRPSERLRVRRRDVLLAVTNGSASGKSRIASSRVGVRGPPYGLPELVGSSMWPRKRTAPVGTSTMAMRYGWSTIIGIGVGGEILRRLLYR